MTTESSSIDDVLALHAANIPLPPMDNVSADSDYSDETPVENSSFSENVPRETAPETSSEVQEASSSDAVDEYGNEAEPEKTYTEAEVRDRVNQAVRDRLARLERNNQHVTQAEQQQIQKQAKDFEYNSESSEPWQKQLEDFIEQTTYKISQKQASQAYLAREQQAQAEFEAKFQDGMSRFSDYHNVVRHQPVTDAMVMATRSMKDPAAFIYAASKRAPQELQRISQIPDQVAQMVEMGKLEERMKATKKQTTNAPRPIGRAKEDLAIHLKDERETTIEEKIAADAQRRRALFNQKRGK